MKLSLPKEVNDILAILKKAGFEAYVVGGCVRDLILGKTTNDWDFTTNATPDQIQKLFPDSFYDNAFGTVGVPSKKKGEEASIIFEITTYRSEVGYSDHRHPDKVSWGKTLEEDLKRRDFTINAMAYDSKSLIDPFSGRKDLKNKVIRAVGVAKERFQEDALRMMRAIRIATELQFLIEEKTFRAIQENASLIASISTERIRDELVKIVSSSYPADGVMLLRNTSLLPYILPELEKCFGVGQASPKRHHIYDVGTHLVMSLKFCSAKDAVTRLATLLHDVGKPVTRSVDANGVVTFHNHEIIGASIVYSIAKRLHFSKKDTQKLVKLVRFHQFTVDAHQTDKAIRRFIRNVGVEYLGDMLSLRIGDRLGGGARETSWRLELFKKRLEEVQKQPFIVADLKVDGYDVMKIFGIGPGPLVGKILTKLFDEVVEKQLANERKILLKRLEEVRQEEFIGKN